VSKATVSGDVKAIVNEWRKQYTEQMSTFLHIQMKRFDVLLNGVWEEARGGRDNALDRALHIMDRQNDLMGVKKGQPQNQQPMAITLITVPSREKPPTLED